MARLSLQEQVIKIASGSGSRAQRLEDLVYMLGLPVRDALNALDTYKPTHTPRTPKHVTFGVEIECINVISSLLQEKVTAKGVNIQSERYNHIDHKTHYKIVSDASICGSNPVEVVSPILEGKSGLESLKIVCDTLNEIGASVNRSCGVHVHLDAKNMTIKHWRNLYINYARLENIIDSFMPQSRRANNNGYCRSIALTPRLEATILHCDNSEQIRSFFASRYYKVNIESLRRHGTVEFRQHGGSIDFEKISMWVSFLQKLLAYSKNNTVENCTTINDVPFLNKQEKQYFKNRINQLAVA